MSEFDAYTDDYEGMLERGLAVSGEAQDFFARGRVAWLAERVAKLGLHPREVLDYGCGTGGTTPLLLELLEARSVVGVDASERSLATARELHSSPSARFQSIRDYEPDGSMDLAYCNGVFHHIPLAERPAAIQYIASSLRPGGLLAFWENNPWNPVTRLAMSQVPFDRDAELVWPGEARRLLRAAGFQPLATDYLFFFPRFAAFLRPLEPALRWLPLGGQYLVLCRKPETAARAA